jgi:hypothetical protein
MKVRRITNDAGQNAVEIEPDRLITVHVLWPAGVPPAPHPEPVYGAFAAVDSVAVDEQFRVRALMDGQGRNPYSALLMLGEDGGWRDD